MVCTPQEWEGSRSRWKTSWSHHSWHRDHPQHTAHTLQQALGGLISPNWVEERNFPNSSIRNETVATTERSCSGLCPTTSTTQLYRREWKCQLTQRSETAEQFFAGTDLRLWQLLRDHALVSDQQHLQHSCIGESESASWPNALRLQNSFLQEQTLCKSAHRCGALVEVELPLYINFNNHEKQFLSMDRERQRKLVRPCSTCEAHLPVPVFPSRQICRVAWQTVLMFRPPCHWLDKEDLHKSCDKTEQN